LDLTWKQSFLIERRKEGMKGEKGRKMEGGKERKERRKV
jgi:hypothetical protein